MTVTVKQEIILKQAANSPPCHV